MARELIQAALAFIDRCRDDPGSEALVTELTRCAHLFGLERFIFTGPPTADRLGRKLLTSDDWPLGWYDIYAERGYLRIDGVGQWALRTNAPFTYGEVPEPLRRRPASKLVRAEARAFGFADGLVVPIHSGRYSHSVLCFTSSTAIDLGPQDRAALHLIAIHAGGILNAMFEDAPGWEELSVREREVLAWTAQGKTAWEISEILAVSERTIAKHLENIRGKLNASTTAQAVAEALRRGEIAF